MDEVTKEQIKRTLCHRHVPSLAAAFSRGPKGLAGACRFSSESRGAVPLIISSGFLLLVTTDAPSWTRCAAFRQNAQASGLKALKRNGQLALAASQHQAVGESLEVCFEFSQTNSNSLSGSVHDYIPYTYS